MFVPEEMKKIALLGTTKIKKDLISFLQDEGVLEINEFLENKKFVKYLNLGYMKEKKPLEGFNEVSEQLVKIRAILGYLEKMGYKPKNVKFSEKDLKHALEKAKELTSLNIADLLNERENILSDLKELEKKEKNIEYLKYFGELDLKDLSISGVNYVLGLINSNDLEKLRKELTEYLSNNFDLIHYSFGNKEVILILYPEKENISYIIYQFNVKEIELPKDFKSYSDEMKKIKETKKMLENKLEDINKKIEKIAKNVDEYKKIENELLVLSDRYVVSMKFLSGKKLFALTGWIKAEDYEKLKKKLKKKFDGEVEIYEIHGDNPPTVLKNPKSLEEFQFLVEFFSLPKKDEIDPTWTLALFVPFMVGMIIGDVGYGIITAILSIILIKKFKNPLLVNTAKIWLISSISSIIFGVVFDEWFGFSHFELIEFLKEFGIAIPITHPVYVGVSRLHNLSLVLLLTILVGIFQLAFGYLLGFINEWHHNKKHAIAKLAWFTLIVGGTLLVFNSFNMLPSLGTIYLPILGTNGILPTILVLLIILSVVLIVGIEGLVGLFEIPSTFGNILSYTRIAMAGVAGVILAEIINSLFLPNPNQGIMALLMFPIFILLHIINTALAMFEAIVQGGRLSLVEFYARFFKGGGRPFRPFKNPFKYIK